MVSGLGSAGCSADFGESDRSLLTWGSVVPFSMEHLYVFASGIDLDASKTAIPQPVCRAIRQRVLISEFNADVLEVDCHFVNFPREEGSPPRFFSQPLQKFVILRS